MTISPGKVHWHEDRLIVDETVYQIYDYDKEYFDQFIYEESDYATISNKMKLLETMFSYIPRKTGISY